MTEISQVVTPVAPPPNPPIGVPLAKKQARPPGLCPIRVGAVSNPVQSGAGASHSKRSRTLRTC
jgi:hypothetical protein